MATTRPTIKTIVFTNEDKYRKIKMVDWLVSRSLIDTATKTYILKGTR